MVGFISLQQIGIKENTGNIDEETKKLKSMAKDVLAKNDIKASKNEEQHYNTAV